MRPALRQVVILLLSSLLALAASAPTVAHDARPVAVTISETQPDVFRFAVRVPPTVEAANQPRVVWPANCVTMPQNSQGVAVMQCEGGLNGREFSLQYPQFNPSLASFYQLTTLDGASITAMLAPTQEAWLVPAEMTPSRVIKDYLLLGVEHIIGGLDHLLFVFGLLVIARTPKRIVLTVTGFTLAHSITLSLSSLGFVNVPIAPVEATIALSIVFLAYEISRQQFDSLTYRYPLLVSFSFGLLHGLGFASALGETGLAEHDILLSLLFFNVGVELGQLLFIFAVMALVLVAKRLLHLELEQRGQGTVSSRTDLLAAYLIGVPAAYWLIDRVAQFG
jgi:hydrogenase/urease accessory protein HupE